MILIELDAYLWNLIVLSAGIYISDSTFKIVKINYSQSKFGFIGYFYQNLGQVYKMIRL